VLVLAPEPGGEPLWIVERDPATGVFVYGTRDALNGRDPGDLFPR
jgi:hypothetical protein